MPVHLYRHASQHLDAAVAAQTEPPGLPPPTQQSSSSQQSPAAVPSQASLISSRHKLHDAVTLQLALDSGWKGKDNGFPAKFEGGDAAAWVHPNLIGRRGAVTVSDQQVTCDV